MSGDFLQPREANLAETIGELQVTINDLRTELQRREVQLDRLHTWDGLMELLDEHWPTDIFPVPRGLDDAKNTTRRDPGVVILDLIRWVDRLSAARDVVRQQLEQADKQMRQVQDLFTGGPDTPCTTVWIDGVECVQVPMNELRRVLPDLADEPLAEAYKPAMVEDRDNDDEPGHGYWETGDYS